MYTWLVSFNADYKGQRDYLQCQTVIEAPDMVTAVTTAEAKIKKEWKGGARITDIVNVKIGRYRNERASKI